MKILFIAQNLGVTSSGISANTFLKELQKREDVDVKIITTCNSIKNKGYENKYIAYKYSEIIPSRILYYLGKKIKRDIIHVFWELKVRFSHKMMFKAWSPDIIMGYASPVAAIKIAEFLGNKYSIPYLIHFTDPIPAPLLWKPDLKYRNMMFNTLMEPFQSATLISMENSEKLFYQQSLFDFDITDKALIIPDSIENDIISRIHNRNDGKLVFVYFGSLYGLRQPHKLFSAFDLFIENTPNAELHIYDNLTNQYNSVNYSKNIGKKIYLKVRGLIKMMFSPIVMCLLI